MPTYRQAHFIRRALDSLLAQTLDDWEALIVDDGSDDDTAEVVRPYLADPRIRYWRLEHNTGLGNALNEGTAQARAPMLAYLPSDDVYYRDHLQSLRDRLNGAPGAVLAFSGVRYHYNRYADGCIPGRSLQLVQCMHRRAPPRWTARDELESDDLERLFWSPLRVTGAFEGTGSVTCEWVSHPAQRHKIMQEPLGGINPFRAHYGVKQALRFHTSVGNAIDEVGQYRSLRERPGQARDPRGLRILLVGELAYNADRVLALEELGHTLYGLWMPRPHWYNTVGPLPFGHVQDLPHDGWRGAVRALAPDLIYAQLNWQAVPFCHEVLMATRGIPFVWHFKEGPFICIEKGTWPQLVDLYRHAEGRIFTSPELRDWFDTVIPGLSGSGPYHVMDGDLPGSGWFDQPRSELLSASDGEVHTVVPGRPIGLHPPSVATLAAQGIHLHFYGDFTHGQWREWIETCQALAPGYLHLHANVDQGSWVREFSRYDAGWLHAFESRNGGEIRRADWDDLNYPARMATLACAGLPMIQRANPSSVVATQALTKRLGTGVFFDSFDRLGALLRDRGTLDGVRGRVWQERGLFTFERHAPGLVNFFRTVIGHASRSGLAATVRLPAAPLAPLAAGQRPAVRAGQPDRPPEAA
jgi:hypothetical protein